MRRYGPLPKDITGQRFGKLLAVELVEVSDGKRDRIRRWRCRCDCGTEPVVVQRNLTAGDTSSCGCIIGKHKRTHGGTGTSEYRVWDAMRRRCSDPKSISYPGYGGRGIKVCERWQDFANFLADMGPRPSLEYSIDRYPNNDGHYEPGNCRWATMREQSNNRRSSRYLTLNAETLTMSQWERRNGLKPGMIFKRLEQGWSIEDAITTPPFGSTRKRRLSSAAVLNEKRVEMIRTMGLTDSHWARVWRVHENTIRHARIGRTWRDHSVPPDTRLRAHVGKWGDLSNAETVGGDHGR